MTADRPQSTVSSMSTQQKVIGVVVFLIFLFLVYEVYGMFGSKKTSVQDMAMANKMSGTTHAMMTSRTPNGAMQMQSNMPPNAPGGMQPQMVIPQQVQIAKQPLQSEREAELIKLQQETEAKYLAAVNELQMLKVEKDIAETNKAIMSAKFDTVQAQKGIVDTLTVKPQMPAGGYGAGFLNPTGAMSGGPASPPPAVMQPQENYAVVSVSQLEYKWSAVLGYSGKLYNVYIGDILPPDGAKVVAIDKSGVTLEKDGVKKKISLVSII